MKPKKVNFSLEELLHLKRHEMPREEFWETFEKQLQCRLALEIGRKRSFFRTNMLDVLYKKWVCWFPLATCLCVFGFVVYTQCFRVEKLSNRFVVVTEDIICHRALKQFVLSVDQQLSSVPVRNLVSGSQKIVATDTCKRFSF
ncbi:MAG: hypothetical protein LBE99_01810 [Puniceicoccales bacterium]|jgi:hypothetical protein|nr:hypothetical protein [Puniceicoccales bacterium]